MRRPTWFSTRPIRLARTSGSYHSKEIRSKLDSKVADLRSVDARAGLFRRGLPPRVRGRRHNMAAHLDIAGPAFLDGKPYGYVASGGPLAYARSRARARTRRESTPPTLSVAGRTSRSFAIRCPDAPLQVHSGNRCDPGAQISSSQPGVTRLLRRPRRSLGRRAVLTAAPASSHPSHRLGTSASTAGGVRRRPRGSDVVGQVLPLRRRFTRS